MSTSIKKGEEEGERCACFECGISLPASKFFIGAESSKICGACLESDIMDMNQSLEEKQVNIQHCLQCDSYLHPPKLRMKAQFGSTELMVFCVRSLKYLNKFLANAQFVGTEADYSESKIIKVKLKLQKDVTLGGGFLVQKHHIVEYLVEDLTSCDSCSAVSSNLKLSSTL